MAGSATRRFLASVGLPDHDLGELPDSVGRFPDGAHYRVEIPSTEGPLAFEAVLDEAERRDVPVVRVSQGSGVFMHTDEELDEMARLGASTINLPTDLTLGQIAAIRTAVDVPLDIYVECPDNIGGFVRYHEIAEIVRVAAPVYLKFGVRGTVDPYPAGGHLVTTLVALSRERVRRARLGLDYLARARDEAGTFVTSRPGAIGLAVPVPLAIRA